MDRFCPARNLISANSGVTEILHSLLALPSLLDTGQLSPLKGQVTHVLSQLVNSDAFYILPSSDLELCKLPREIFVPDREGDDAVVDAPAHIRKRGRPSRRDRQKRANQTSVALETWLQQEECPASDVPELPADDHDQGAVSPRDAYLIQKGVMLDVLARDESGREVLRAANEAVLRRLGEIDEMAASQGLEVGGEGGEKTGLTRIEKVVGEMGEDGCGILGLVGGYAYR